MTAPGPAVRRTIARSVAAFAVVLASLAGASPPVGAAPDRPVQDPTGSTDSAILDLVSCLRGSHRLAVVFLIDESGSLQGNDPDDRRVDAAQAALSTLTGLTRGSSTDRTRVDVAFAAFANRYRPVRNWTALTAASQRRLLGSLASFAKFDRGTDTDFVNALSGARRALAERTAALTADGSKAPCKAVLLFTDGQYDIGVRTAEDVVRLGRTKPYAPGIELMSEASVVQAEDAGRKALCDEGGLADGLRDDDITLLAVALAKGPAAAVQDLLKALSTGAAGPITCGRAVGSPPGSYLAADDVDLLIGRFDEVAARVAGGTVVPGPAIVLCGVAACPAGQRTVNLDASIRRLRVFALAPQPGMVVQVEGPAGTVSVAAAEETTLGSVTVRASEVAARGYVVELDRPSKAGDWDGSWKITLLDPTGEQVDVPAALQLYLFSDLGIGPTEALTFVRGEPAEISASLQAPEGIDVGQLVATGSATLRLEDAVTGATEAVMLTGPPIGPYTGTFVPPADYRSSAYLATLELQATTADGAAIVARSATTPVAVRHPAGAIQLAPVALALPTLTGAGSTSADLILVGGETDGCVWFGPDKALAPKEAGALTVTYDGREAVSEASCIKVPAGTTETVSVEVEPANRATGAVRGVIEVHEKTEGAEASVTDIPYRLDLAVGIDQARRLVLGLLLLSAGVLLPLALLLVINALSARFQSLDAVQASVLPVRVQGQQLFRTDGGRPRALKFRRDDFTPLSGTGHTRRFTFGGIDFRARTARNPFRSTVAMAAPSGGAERLKGGAGRRVELDPGLVGSWIFLLDPERTRRAGRGAAEGDLITFVAKGDLDPQLRRLMPDLAARLPGTAADLGGLVRSKASKRRKATADLHRRPPDGKPADEVPAGGEPADGKPPVGVSASVDGPPSDDAPGRS